MDSDESSQNETQCLHISRDKFTLKDRQLGRGDYGIVMLAALKPDAGGSGTLAEVTVKRIQASKLNIKPATLAFFLERETRVWSSLRHEKILRFTEYHIEEDFKNAYLFSPYMPNGNAQTYLAAKQSTMDERFTLLHDTVVGLEYLHNLKHPVIHGNLKAANVLINDRCRAVLSDVGLFTLLDYAGSNSIPGYSLRWSSPELLLEGAKRTTSSDMWAWGCLALEMMTGEYPFAYSFFVRDKILRGQTPEPSRLPQTWPNGLLGFVRQCWSFEPQNRPDALTCAEILNTNLDLIEPLREEVIALLGDSFISSDRLRPEPSQARRDRATKKAKLLPSGTLVIMKEINLNQIRSISLRVEFFKRFAGQMAVLSSPKHENILDVIGYSATDDFRTVLSVTPRMVAGNLADYMQKEVVIHGKFELARDTMNGLQHLHSREPPVVHGNVHPFNVLINEAGKAVLSDAGLGAIDWHPIPPGPQASVRWSSPEVNLGGSPVLQSDIWSWACIVLQLWVWVIHLSIIQGTKGGYRINPLMWH